jgi:hypothetical protein
MTIDSDVNYPCCNHLRVSGQKLVSTNSGVREPAMIAHAPLACIREKHQFRFGVVHGLIHSGSGFSTNVRSRHSRGADLGATGCTRNPARDRCFSQCPTAGIASFGKFRRLQHSSHETARKTLLANLWRDFLENSLSCFNSESNRNKPARQRD